MNQQAAPQPKNEKSLTKSRPSSIVKRLKQVAGVCDQTSVAKKIPVALQLDELVFGLKARYG